MSLVGPLVVAAADLPRLGPLLTENGAGALPITVTVPARQAHLAQVLELVSRWG